MTIKTFTKHIITILIFLALMFCLLCLPSYFTDWTEEAHAADRCYRFVQLERVYHWKYFGMDFPYWYGVGQIRQESNCRPDALAFDGGKGLSQFMPATLGEVQRKIGTIDIWNPNDAIRAQAFYMSQLHKSNFGAEKPLWVTYMFYNSGPGTVKKEFHRAGILDYNTMKSVCKRKVLQLKSGPLDLCDVGYDYPVKIHKYGKQYSLFPDKMRYW